LKIFVYHCTHQIMDGKDPKFRKGRSDMRISWDVENIVNDMLESQVFGWRVGCKGHHDGWGGCNQRKTEVDICQ
jgi:hypothetical protein